MILIGMLSDRDVGSLAVGRLLTEEGAEAVRRRLTTRSARTFHVHAVSTVDEGLEILSGRPAGERTEPRAPFAAGSFNAAVEQALADNLERLKALRANSHGVALTGSSSG